MLCGGMFFNSFSTYYICYFICLIIILDEINAIVVDIGAKNSRFGFAGQDSPRHIIDSVILFFSFNSKNSNFF